MRLLLVAATFGSFCGCATALQAGRIDALVAARTTASVLPPTPALTRRAWAAAAAASSAFLPALRTRALITAPICASGVGDGCEELAESPLIAELQARSAEKREQRRKEALERYSVNNFNDFFAVENKLLVRHADGTFGALPKDVIAAGLKSGRIKYGTGGGGIADFSTSRAPFEFNESLQVAVTANLK